MDTCKNHLVKIVQDLSLARSVTRVAEIVRTAARQFAKADGATFVLRDEGKCHYFDEDAIAPLWKGLKFPLDACVSGWSMLNGRAAIIPDIYKDSRIPIAAYKPTFVKSLLMTPIREQNSIGAIGVYWAKLHHPSNEEIDMLAALANATSVSMQNIELHAALELKVQELERAAKLKDQFLLMLSHELRTPMNSILGWSEILQGESEPLKPELRAGVEAIHRNAQTEMRLIGDLLDSSQILAGRLGLEKSLVDLSRVVRTAAQSMRVQLSKKSIELRVLFPDSPALIEGDADRLLQIISNLLSNAAKFTPARGTIEVELREEGADYVIAVRDNGEGIDAGVLPDIFERFQSQRSPLNRRHGGLGLGLAIVKSLVEAHGGTVHAYSEGPERGSEFVVRLRQLEVAAPAVAVPVA